MVLMFFVKHTLPFLQYCIAMLNVNHQQSKDATLSSKHANQPSKDATLQFIDATQPSKVATQPSK